MKVINTIGADDIAEVYWPERTTRGQWFRPEPGINARVGKRSLNAHAEFWAHTAAFIESIEYMEDILTERDKAIARLRAEIAALRSKSTP